MGTTSVVESARRALGPVGAFLPFSRTSAASADQQRDAVGRLERAGYRAGWANEGVGGKDALVQLAVLLAATERMVFGTSIANIWARAPQTAHGAAALLAQAFPGRFVLGLGVGYPHLVIGLAVVAEADQDRAKATARQTVAGRLGAPGTYAATMARLGYSEQEISEVSDRLVDALVGYGDAAAIATRVREHLAAGADHVLVMPTGTDFADGVDQLEQLAPTLAGVAA
jgi:alkanesulfonate monooxygenase SsuD/methylene tetrahydromethanopterin reductase-like flavin-dependent oxidoreductase (luciferase family)